MTSKTLLALFDPFAVWMADHETVRANRRADLDFDLEPKITDSDPRSRVERIIDESWEENRKK